MGELSDFARIVMFASAGLLAAMPLVAPAQAAPEAGRPLAAVIDEYVREGLKSNLGLRAQSLEVERAQAALDAARAKVSALYARWQELTRAEGGRTIELPLGDALNPAYQTLNDLLVQQGQQPRFPVVQNETIKFLREREQESFVRLSQPIYDARLGAQRRGAENLYQASRHGLEAYQLRLARDVRQAYYRWLAARESIAVLEATEKLAAENERVNDSLYRNGKVTRDLRLRAEAEHLEITQQLLRARAAEDLGRRYLNLLCNAPLAREPEAVAVNATDLPRLALRMPTTRGEALESLAVGRRAELRELDSGIAGAGESENAARAAFKPQLAFAVDAGTQGAEWDYSVEDSYVLASFIVRFNLFNGGGDQAAIREAKARSAELQAGRALAEQQIRIEVQAAITDLEVAEAVASGGTEATAGDLAVPQLPTVPADESLATAARLMSEGRCTHLLAVQPSTGQPVGVISALGLAAVLATEAA